MTLRDESDCTWRITTLEDALWYLSLRTYNRLRREGFLTIEDLIRHRDSAYCFRQFKGLGVRGDDEIHVLLACVDRQRALQSLVGC